MYSQAWSPTPSTTALAPELRTQKRSAAMPLKYASPCAAKAVSDDCCLSVPHALKACCSTQVDRPPEDDTCRFKHLMGFAAQACPEPARRSLVSR